MSRLLYPLVLIAALVLALGLGACVTYTPGPLPPAPVPPGPTPPGPLPPPEPPLPEAQVPRATFQALVVPGPAEQLSGLPAPERVVRLQDGTEVHVWVLDEPRPDDGGWIRWEVFVEGDTIVASLPY